jgi:hypothetical protein
MAKLKTDPIKIGDMTEYLSGQDDFRLEIAVLRSFKSRELTVLHGGTYEDPVTKLPRQFDIRGTIRKNGRSVHLAIECKNLKESFPLLVSTLPRTNEESFHEVVFSHETTFRDMIGSNSDTIRLTSPNSIYEKLKPCGKSTTQVGRDSNDKLVTGDGEVYGKWSQAVSSAFDLVSDSDTEFEKNEHGVALSIIIPILVVNDGVLWQADYDEAGELKEGPKQVLSSEIYLGKDLWTGPMGVGYTFSHLHIYALSIFDLFLDKLTIDTDYWDTLFPIEQIQQLLEEKEKD